MRALISYKCQFPASSFLTKSRLGSGTLLITLRPGACSKLIPPQLQGRTWVIYRGLFSPDWLRKEFVPNFPMKQEEKCAGWLVGERFWPLIKKEREGEREKVRETERVRCCLFFLWLGWMWLWNHCPAARGWVQGWGPQSRVMQRWISQAWSLHSLFYEMINCLFLN